MMSIFIMLFSKDLNVLIFMKTKRRSISVVNAVLLLIGVEKKTWLMSCFLDRGD